MTNTIDKLMRTNKDILSKESFIYSYQELTIPVRFFNKKLKRIN